MVDKDQLVSIRRNEHVVCLVLHYPAFPRQKDQSLLQVEGHLRFVYHQLISKDIPNDTYHFLEVSPRRPAQMVVNPHLSVQ
jgi:hypothetical protein